MLTLKRRPGEVLFVGDTSLQNINGRSIRIRVPEDGDVVLQLHRMDDGRFVMAKRHGNVVTVGRTRISRMKGQGFGPTIRVSTESYYFDLRLKKWKDTLIIFGIEAKDEIKIQRKELLDSEEK